MMNLKLHSEGKESHKKVLNNELKNQIDLINSSNDLNDKEKQEQINILKLKFRKEAHSLDSNLY